MSDLIRLDIARAKSTAVGAEHGITPGDIKDIAPRVQDAHAILMKERKEGAYGFWDVHKDKATFADIKQKAAAFSEHGYDNIVVMGIGGSALGMTALATALLPPYHNLMTRAGRKKLPRLFVMDNIDPITFRQMLRICPPKKTLYNVISKSGETAETMTQLMIVLDVLESKVGKDAIKNHLVVTTGPRDKSKSLMHPVVDEYGLTSFVIPLNVGGRFSVFTPVGMFPAAMLGMDLDAMCEGCAAMDAACAPGDVEQNPAYLHAAVQYIAATQKGKVNSVMMPYSDQLRDVADWYRQIWAESLGKEVDLQGNTVFAGQTPVKALGVTDQHSQVQLYREGPNDKIFNILEVKRFDKSLKIPATLTNIKELDYLRGATMNKLMAAELQGTVDALKKSVRPVCRITLPRVNANTVAQLLYMLEVETAMAGRLYNVNTFNQPGVEEGKVLARQLMGARG